MRTRRATSMLTGLQKWNLRNVLLDAALDKEERARRVAAAKERISKAEERREAARLERQDRREAKRQARRDDAKAEAKRDAKRDKS